MIEALNRKYVNMMYPQLKDNGDFANNTYADTFGWNHLTVLLQMGATDAAVGSDAEDAKPYLEECDTAAGTYTKIDAAEFAAVIADDDDGKMLAVDINLANGTRKRYIRVMEPHSADGTAGAAMAILGILSQPQIAPTTAAGRGLKEHLII